MVKQKLTRKGNRISNIAVPAEEFMGAELRHYVTTMQGAKMLGVDPSQVARLVRDGKLKGIKLGHDWLVFAPSIEKYLETKSPKGRPTSRPPQLQIVS